ncbi:trehalase-like domain-containing protein [Kitasatospora sp. GP82]|uniref:trehalase-like domain-containing protein n=1 Tax=Kitasatospora sp. GP82 TaxID=3035089 RepID=UPI00247589EE|nr:trehalase-like domain-containing protein [Kitasatospora sp. GP82]
MRDYALLADGERGAIIGLWGDLVWMCAPRWESDAVFSRLIGGEGLYAVTPRERFASGGFYEESTLIWRSRWVTTGGIVECRESLAFPGDRHTAVILRRIMAVEGEAHVRVVLQPCAGFGSWPLRRLRQQPSGVWTARSGKLKMRWTGRQRGECRAVREQAGPTDPGSDPRSRHLPRPRPGGLEHRTR